MLTVLALAALLQAPAAAPAPAPTLPRAIALARPETATAGPTLEVSSTTVAAGGFLPLAQSGYGRNYSPSVQWTAGPAATKSYVLIVEDPDAGLSPTDPRPLLHWLAYDIAADVLVMKDKTKNLDHVKLLAPVDPDETVSGGRHKGRAKEGPSFDQGPNDHGGIGWTGPHPPVGDPPHHYHLQVFALDRKDIAKPGAELGKVLAAMRGHVVAKGEMVVLYRQLPDKVRKDKAAEKRKGAEAPTPAPAPVSTPTPAATPG